MARAKSPEKRHALLRAAVQEIAQAGLGASTARIAKAANLAEGTLFTYFASKNELLNELYIEMKSEVYRRVNVNFPHEAELRERTRHVWIETLHWSLERPEERKVSRQLSVSNVVTEATRERMAVQSDAVARTMRELARRGSFKSLPTGFAASAVGAMQEAVIDTLAREPRQQAKLIERAFEAFWRIAE